MVPVMPFSEQLVLCRVPSEAIRGQPKLRIDEVWDALAVDVSPLEEKVLQIQYVREDCFRVWLKSLSLAEDLIFGGMVIRNQPVIVRPYKSGTWVTVTHLPYGISEDNLRSTLSHYGKVKEVTL